MDVNQQQNIQKKKKTSKLGETKIEKNPAHSHRHPDEYIKMRQIKDKSLEQWKRAIEHDANERGSAGDSVYSAWMICV